MQLTHHDLTRHETLILKDLHQIYTSHGKQQALYLLLLFTGVLGLGLLLMVRFQSFSIIVGAALCGGLLGVCIEKAYLKQIVMITLKLYRIHHTETLNK